MRVIQTYTFRMSPKMPYSDYPAIAHRFLEEQNLTSHRFLYFFDELVIPSIITAEETLTSGSCAKAVKDCPALGEIRFFDDDDYRSASPLFYLSNIDTDTGCTEADILPHMKKIHRRYGFCQCNLYYFKNGLRVLYTPSLLFFRDFCSLAFFRRPVYTQPRRCCLWQL